MPLTAMWCGAYQRKVTEPDLNGFLVLVDEVLQSRGVSGRHAVLRHRLVASLIFSRLFSREDPAILRQVNEDTWSSWIHLAPDLFFGCL